MKCFSLTTFSIKFAIKLLLKIPTYLIPIATLPWKHQCLKTSDILKLMSWLMINHKVVYLKIRGVVKFSTAIFKKNLLLSLSVKKLFKSVNIWQNCRQEGGLHVDRGQNQFPVTLMMQMHIIDHSVGCAVWTLWKYFCQLIKYCSHLHRVLFQ